MEAVADATAAEMLPFRNDARNWSLDHPVIETATMGLWFSGRDVASSLEYLNEGKVLRDRVDEADKLQLGQLLQAARQRKIAGSIANEDQVAGRIFCLPFVQVGLIAVAQAVKPCRGQRPAGQVVAHHRNLTATHRPHRAGGPALVGVTLLARCTARHRGQRRHLAGFFRQFRQHASNRNLGFWCLGQ